MKHRITKYPYGTNVPATKSFDNEDIPNSIGELKTMYKKFAENDTL